ncbi:protein phosphatase PP2A regulatory subunit B [Puccinia graminis f. sp. tritici CRL 75-36-700-3]|uniref:Protein phosphatase PP2A regulatory subunit B n=1 Tax=Puccinia graminis f. sp. tritici (strain CRL 75-36-700-3 / race SCCL) TaxID=418459 RepID=E3L9N4_PUCGT|nr:protein phosphatase PP2A regulatory subunit B [Puccinia graminis f. sp. tritici CRL 75-36-700-3]EFP93259.2 protein phosphatase PP2A regulatory subunit B [Puccinia graminis f. sp. tritici CRL 75-36-700-3]
MYWMETRPAGGDKGEVEDITEADIISTVEFDHTGDYLATGDKGGRVVLFERNESGKKGCEYKFYTEFQSHEPEFDYLKSLEIEEKINKIRWCKRQNSAHFLLSTNDKTIKLWKVFEKSLKVVAENNHMPAGFQPQPVPTLKLPRMAFHDTIIAAVPRKVYANAHAYHINSISINSDGETYLSADDLRINLWNLSISDQSFNILDIKPANMEELTEVITAADFHPLSCNLFCYSSSKGTVKLADMRSSALCDTHAKLYEEEEDPSNKSSRKMGATSCHETIFICGSGDINMDKAPLKTISVHDHLKGKLCDLYENDCIFDKFEGTFSGDGKVTTDIVLQADKSAFKAKKIGASSAGGGAGGSHPGSRNAAGQTNVPNPKIQETENIDFGKRIMHASWHPREDTIAIAATNNLFLFSK